MTWQIRYGSVHRAKKSYAELLHKVETLFEHDYDFEKEYHTMLNGKWNQ